MVKYTHLVGNRDFPTGRMTKWAQTVHTEQVKLNTHGDRDILCAYTLLS